MIESTDPVQRRNVLSTLLLHDAPPLPPTRPYKMLQNAWKNREISVFGRIRKLQVSSGFFRVLKFCSAGQKRQKKGRKKAVQH
jgi:hypothetical protein